MNIKSSPNTLVVFLVFTVIAVVTYFLLNITSNVALNGDSVKKVSDQVPQQVLDAQESVSINESEFILETYLWRDFMPVSPPEGKPLTAIARVKVINDVAFPSDIDANRIWIINNDEVWESEFSTEERVSIVADTLEKIARNGPKWEPASEVDVIVRLVDSQGDEYFLKAVDQYIGETK